MSDLDEELAALEKEVENENKVSNQNQKKPQNNYSNNKNININYGNNNNTNSNTTTKSKKVDYEDYGDNSNGLEDFLNDDNNDGFNNNKNSNYGNNYNNFNNNNNNNFNYNNNNNFNYNNYNNFNNNNYNNNFNNNYNNYNNNYNNYNNFNNYNNYNSPNNNFNNKNNKMNSNQNQQMNNRQNMNNMNSKENNYQNMNNPQSRQSYNNKNQSQTQKPQAQQNTKQSQPIQKQSQVQQNQKESKVQPQRQSKISQSKNSEINNEPVEDIYPEKQENMYHKVDEMKSLTVLEEEIALCDKIIAFKKKKGLDYDDWETKKDLAELKINNTKALIENGNMDFEGYKKLIIGELQYEKKILKFTENDKKSKPYELKEIKRRIERRIEVIGKELTQNPEEDNDEEEKTEKKDEAPNNNSQKAGDTQLHNDNQNKVMNQNNQSNKQKINNKVEINDKLGPQDSEPKNNEENKQIENPHQQAQHGQHHHSNPQDQPQKQPIQNGENKIKVPPQYIIQKKVLVTDPKTGKQGYIIKNVVDPRYEQALKQKQIQQNQATTQNQQHHHKQAPTPQNQQHTIQKKVLVTDPKTGKQGYVIKTYPDPRYAQAQKQNIVPQNQTKVNLQKPSANDTKIEGTQPNTKKNPENPGVKNQNVKQNQQASEINKEEKEKYQKYVNALIKEYTEAKEYFKKTGFEKQLAKSREDLKILVYAKQKIDYKNYKEVKLSSLPKPITPEYIFGYTENERMEKFKIVLSQLIKDKNDIEQKTKSILEKLQKLKRKELEKAKEAVKPKLDELKTKKEKIVKLMDGLKEKFKDKWTPAPLYQKCTEQEQIEKVSYEGCKYGLNIKVGKTDYDKDKLSLIIMVEASKSRVLKKEIKLKELGDFNEEFKWEFTGDEWKNIYKSFLFVELYREHVFSTDKKGSGKVDLNNLRRGVPIKSDCKFEIESKRVEPIVNFIITPIMPQGKKYYETISKEAIRITKIFPPFTGKQHIELDNSNNKPKPATVPKKEGNETKNPSPVNNNTTGTDKDGKEPIIDKSKFKPEELEDVDIIDNLNSLKVLEFKINELEAKIKKIDGRTPRELLQKKIKMNYKKKQIEEGMGDGSISPKDYMEFMKIQLEHDQLLAMYMKQNNQQEKMKTVLGRVVLIKQEMEELKKFI